ncbi:Blp family class II bacteriocin [Streptococcus tangpeifui]|uniref:Blp family class II bacteriocin n=1 Tax=Streptococcus tangpeifui TaxID=2709400 RepID=UPI0013EE3A4B|nr:MULTISPECIES: Blp family class II bacteriocin [unclassified Streptococcus]
MTTKTLEQFDVMDEQALATVEGGGYWDDYDAVGAGAAAISGTAAPWYLLQTCAPVVDFLPRY